MPKVPRDPDPSPDAPTEETLVLVFPDTPRALMVACQEGRLPLEVAMARTRACRAGGAA